MRPLQWNKGFFLFFVLYVVTLSVGALVLEFDLYDVFGGLLGGFDSEDVLRSLLLPVYVLVCVLNLQRLTLLFDGSGRRLLLILAGASYTLVSLYRFAEQNHQLAHPNAAPLVSTAHHGFESDSDSMGTSSSTNAGAVASTFSWDSALQAPAVRELRRRHFNDTTREVHFPAW